MDEVLGSWQRKSKLGRPSHGQYAGDAIIHMNQGMTPLTVTREQVLAFAVYEIRLLLAGYLGSQSTAEPAVRMAAHLAYALHDQADAVLQGMPFDTGRAMARLAAADRLLATDFRDRLLRVTAGRD